MSQKLAAYDSAGKITGFYDSTFSPVPSGVKAIDITDAEWQACLSTPGYTVANGALIAPTAPTAAQELVAAKTSQLATLNDACGVAIAGGFPATISGLACTVTLSQTDQTNGLMGATTAQAALASGPWAADTTFAANSIILESGVCYVTLGGGKSGATVPSWPADFQTPVTDGSVTWYKLGFWFGTSDGNLMVDPQTAISLYGQSVAFVNACRSKYQSLKAKVQAAATVAEVQAITW